MVDRISQSDRSRIMSRIRAKNTKPEVLVRKFLHAQGMRFRLHVRDMPGTPDILLPKFKAAIFVNGCFWHGHEGCKQGRTPKSNVAFWEAKIERNRARDLRKTEQLKEAGWNVLTIWECEISPEKLSLLVDRIRNPTPRP